MEGTEDVLYQVMGPYRPYTHLGLWFKWMNGPLASIFDYENTRDESFAIDMFLWTLSHCLQTFSKKKISHSQPLLYLYRP